MQFVTRLRQGVDTIRNKLRPVSKHKRGTTSPKTSLPVDEWDASEVNPPNDETSRHDDIKALIEEKTTVDLTALRRTCWRGIPSTLRAEAWALLSGYHTPSVAMQEATIEKKRAEYAGFVATNYDGVDWDAEVQATSSALGTISKTVGEHEVAIMKQIRKDLHRTFPRVQILRCPQISTLLERVLYIWSLRHPASGYVQGLGDVVVPFVLVFLAKALCPDSDPDTLVSLSANDASSAMERLSIGGLIEIESAIYWCSSRMLGFIQDHYTVQQSGVHSMIQRLETVIQRVDQPLFKLIRDCEIDFLQFAFRWFNCLLLREISLPLGIRLFDTYLCEDNEFPELHVYVCAALLQGLSGKLYECDGDSSRLMHLLQNMPTDDLTERDVEELVSAAFLMQQLFNSAPSHLQSPTKSTV